MKKLDYVSPEVESIPLYSADEISTGDILDVSQGTVETPGGWVD